LDGKPRFRKPEGALDLPALEEQLLARWKAEGTREKVLSRKDGRPTFVFCEGPPTANGRPGIHHVFARMLKDVVCRYQTMKGFHVPRKAGWDTHGLPVEIEVQKELGISLKPEIEAYGIGPFNEKCRASVFKYKEEWERLSERMGYWLDYAHPYVTCDNEYISSLWSILARFFDKGLLEKGHRIPPWCRAAAPASSHEVAQGYQDVQGPRSSSASRARTPGAAFLVWTTTPWTLPSNVALAVNSRADYVRVPPTKKGRLERGADPRGALGRRCSRQGEVEVVEKFAGKTLSARPTSGRSTYVRSRAAARARVAGEPRLGEDGSGIVHRARVRRGRPRGAA
jgi:isoleucyl-tRNA synthetase